MSDEIENSPADDDIDNNYPSAETDNNTDKQSAVNADAQTSGQEISESQPDEQVSVVDDPDIQASLKQLSLSESVQNKVRVHTSESVKNIVEAAIHAASKAITLDKLLILFPEEEVVDKAVLRQAIEQLMQDYQHKGVELIEVSGGFRFQVVQDVAPWVSRLWEEKPQKYSRALLETLALVAYRQPITRGEIEEIRGVSVSSHIMRTLVDREWVRVIGHRDVPGKPAMYATTKQFLDYFGLKKLDELPTLSEIRDLDTINAELDFGEATNAADSGSSTQNENADNESEDMQKPEQADSVTDSLTDSATMEDVDEIQSRDDRINIDEELAALKETYKEIESIEQREISDQTSEPDDDVERPGDASEETP